MLSEQLGGVQLVNPVRGGDNVVGCCDCSIPVCSFSDAERDFYVKEWVLSSGRGVRFASVAKRCA